MAKFEENPLNPPIEKVLGYYANINNPKYELFRSIEKLAREIYIANNPGFSFPIYNSQIFYAEEGSKNIEQRVFLNYRWIHADPLVFDSYKNYLSDENPSEVVPRFKKSEIAKLMLAKFLVHEFIHAYLSANLKISFEEDSSKKGVIVSGLRPGKYKYVFNKGDVVDGEIKEFGFLDLDEAVTEYLAILYVVKFKNIELNKKVLEMFLQISSYSQQTIKLFEFIDALEDENKIKFIDSLIEAKKTASIKPIIEFYKKYLNVRMSAKKLKNLDF